MRRSSVIRRSSSLSCTAVTFPASATGIPTFTSDTTENGRWYGRRRPGFSNVASSDLGLARPVSHYFRPVTQICSDRHPPPQTNGAGPLGRLHDSHSTLPLGACRRTHPHFVCSAPPRDWSGCSSPLSEGGVGEPDGYGFEGRLPGVRGAVVVEPAGEPMPARFARGRAWSSTRSRAASWILRDR